MPQNTPHNVQPRSQDYGDAAEHLPLTPGVCDWCGSTFEETPNGRPKRFCSAECKAKWWIWAGVVGKKVVHALIRWRKHRGRKGTPGEGALSEVAEIIDKAIEARKADK